MKTHLRKGLAATEAVNLHLVEARDLHGGAEHPGPGKQSQNAGHSGTPASESQAHRCSVRELARGDDALPGAGSARSRGLPRRAEVRKVTGGGLQKLIVALRAEKSKMKREVVREGVR